MTKEKVAQLKHSLSVTIKQIEEIRDRLTEDNAGFFNIEINQNRKLDPIFQGPNAIGFEQISGDILSLKIENKANIGKVFT